LKFVCQVAKNVAGEEVGGYGRSVDVKDIARFALIRSALDGFEIDLKVVETIEFPLIQRGSGIENSTLLWHLCFLGSLRD
jgi:hypothetical protein